MVGGDYIPRNIRLAAMDGRIVNIAYLEGSRVKADFMPVMLKRLTLTGSTLRPRSLAFKAGVAGSLRSHVWPWIEAEKIKPVIDKSFSLKEAGYAHRLMESSAHIGKIVLLVQER